MEPGRLISFEEELEKVRYIEGEYRPLGPLGESTSLEDKTLAGRESSQSPAPLARN